MYKKLFTPKYIFKPIFFFIALILMECIVKLSSTGGIFSRGLFYTMLFTIPISMLFTFISSLFQPKHNKLVCIILLILPMIWYLSQTVYYDVFKTFYQVKSIAMAGAAIGSFTSDVITGILNSTIYLILIFVPLVLLLLIIRRDKYPDIFSKFSYKKSGIYFASFVVAQIVAVIAVMASTSGILSPAAIYTTSWTTELSISNFGFLTTFRLDLSNMLKGDTEEESTSAKDTQTVLSETPTDLTNPANTNNISSTIILGDENNDSEDTEKTEEVVYEPNILDIDFETLISTESDAKIAKMHTYFSEQTPTLKNEYTGMFEGKNLIFLTAEGFWQYAVHEKYTPTLYKLVNEGFVFNNFYNPLWWVSTIDGEFAATSGLLPSNQFFAFNTSSSNHMPFFMGNMLKNEGYPTKAYHNHTYTYYDRHLSHPNMGYEYFGLGNGLNVTEVWPASDLEMMELTIPDAIAGEKPFHNYYMTVSGHLNYSFIGNTMSKKNKDAVADLEMSEEAQAYIACNIELDKALEYTIQQLEAAGELENTVICLSADHYPYGMTPETWDEFYGGDIDENFEIFRSPLILWSGDMEEPIVIDKPCYSVDILPTLLNLFGLEYDSRLLMGRDILSDSPGLVLFANRSFITDEGKYNSVVDLWMPNEDSDAGNEYATEIYSILSDKFRYSNDILTTDYYQILNINLP